MWYRARIRLEFQLVLWTSSCYILLAWGHFLFVSVNIKIWRGLKATLSIIFTVCSNKIWNRVMRSAQGNAGERWKTSIGLLYNKRMDMRFPTKITSSCIWVAIPVEWGHQLRREKSGPGQAKCRSCLPKGQALLTYRDWIGLLAGSDNMLPKRVFSFISAEKKNQISHY